MERNRAGSVHQRLYTIGGKPRILETGMEKSQYHVIDQLAKALRGEEADLCSGTEALQVIAIMDQILQSCLKQ